jgi:hypothetical protein
MEQLLGERDYDYYMAKKDVYNRILKEIHVMEIEVEGNRRNKKFVESLLISMLRQLKIENCSKALLIRIADECDGDNEGMTLDRLS